MRAKTVTMITMHTDVLQTCLVACKKASTDDNALFDMECLII